MSTPICSRCQKIYSQGTPPAKCVNCGGVVKAPGAVTKPVTSSAPKTSARSTRGPISNSSPLEDLDFAVATYRALTESRIFTVGALVSKSEDELFNRYGLDSKTISEIKAVLYKANLSLLGNSPRPTTGQNSASKVTTAQEKTSPKTNPNAEAGNQPGVPRSCSKKMCLGIAENTVQHLSDRKQIILRPITSVPVPGAEYICLSHTMELNAPPGWRLIKQFPNSNEKVVKAPTTSQVSTSTTSEGSGCVDVFVAIFGFIILAAIVIGAGWLVIEFFSWLSSDTGGGGGGDGSNQPFRMPRWRRR